MSNLVKFLVSPSHCVFGLWSMLVLKRPIFGTNGAISIAEIERQTLGGFPLKSLSINLKEQVVSAECTFS